MLRFTAMFHQTKHGHQSTARLSKIASEPSDDHSGASVTLEKVSIATIDLR